MGRTIAAALVAVLALQAPRAAAEGCHRVRLDAGRPSAPIGATPTLRNLAGGEVYISLSTARIEDLSSNPNDIVRATGFVLAPGQAVGAGTTHLVVSVDNETYIVQLARRAVPATVEICSGP